MLSRRHLPNERSRPFLVGFQPSSGIAASNPVRRRRARRPKFSGIPESIPQRLLGGTLLVRDSSQRQYECAIEKVAPRRGVRDTVQDDWPTGTEPHFVGIGTKPTRGKTATGGQLAQVSESQGRTADTLSMAIRCWLLAAMNRSRSSPGGARNGVELGSTNARKMRVVVDLLVPGSPTRTSTG